MWYRDAHIQTIRVINVASREGMGRMSIGGQGCGLGWESACLASPVLHGVEAHAYLESQLLEGGGRRMKVSKLSLATE